MTAAYASLTAIDQKIAPAVLFRPRRDPDLFPAADAALAGSASPDGAHADTIEVGSLVLPPGDDRPWRVLDLYEDKAQIEFVGDAWARIKTVPASGLRIDARERATTATA